MIANVSVPLTYEDTMNHPDLDSWLEACTDELATLRETKTYVPVKRSEVDPHNVVRCWWVFTLKKKVDGSIKCYKVHIVTKGFSQIYMIDYEETFAPIVKWSSICILLTLATQSNLEVHQMDVKMAFLNGNLEHDIFMQPPPGCADYGQKDLVWKLEKSLYGLKQASWSWYTKVKNKLKKLHFSHSDSDHAIFIYSNKGTFCIITLYVDNLMILSNHLPLLQKNKSQLISPFTMNDLGKIHGILGLEVTN